MFDRCISRHGFDPKCVDFTWKQNRLLRDKEALKSSVMNVIKKKPKKEQENEQVIIFPLIISVEGPVVATTLIISLHRCSVGISSYCKFRLSKPR